MSTANLFLKPGHALFFVGIIVFGLSGCAPETALGLAAQPQGPSLMTPTIADASAVTPPSAPGSTPTAPSAPASNPGGAPAPSSTPDPFVGLRIDDLAARDYGGAGIVVGEVVKSERYFVQYAMSYESDGLTITGLIDIPVSEGPFPVIVVNHGYLRAVEYQPGFDSWRVADWLAAQGYIAVMPDYRNYGGSDSGPNPFRIGFAIDIMNLIAQLDSLPQAIPEQVGIVGHSMGGEASMWPMVISDQVDAVVLYASMSGDVARNWEHRWLHWPSQHEAMRATALIYGNPADNPEAYAEISPVNYLDRVRMPVMIHHGTMDESVPYWWSEELWGLMEDAGVDVTFWPSPGGKHAYSGRGFETFMQRNLEFFDEHVRGDVNTP